MILTRGRRRLRFTMKVPFWLLDMTLQQAKFPAPAGRFRGREPLNPKPLLNSLG